MPVVGQRYRYKALKDDKGFLTGLFKSEGIFTFDSGSILRFAPEHFWNMFEELSTYQRLKDHYKLHIRAQSLVNALEANRYNNTCTTPVVDLSKPEPKIDIKEERVEPVSIWKDVSELPNHYTEVLLKGNSSVARGYYYPSNGVFTILNEREDRSVGVVTTKALQKYCTLTDFINSFEQMQKDIEELKKK